MNTVIKRDELGNLSFAFGYISKYRYFKQKLLENEYDKLPEMLTGLITEQYENLQQMIEVEMVVNAIQYCSELGAFAIMVKQKKINNIIQQLSTLKEKSITDFYRGIQDADKNLLKMYMGYHEMEIHEDDEEKYNRSCERYKNDIVKLSKFYNSFYGLYLSYKHGLRMIPTKNENGVKLILEACKDNTFTAWTFSEMWWLDSIEVTEIINNLYEKLYMPLIRKKFADFCGFSFADKSVSITVTSTEAPDPERPISLDASFSYPWYIHNAIEPKPFY